jgi:hypothetical protein
MYQVVEDLKPEAAYFSPRRENEAPSSAGLVRSFKSRVAAGQRRNRTLTSVGPVSKAALQSQPTDGLALGYRPVAG